MGCVCGDSSTALVTYLKDLDISFEAFNSQQFYQTMQLNAWLIVNDCCDSRQIATMLTYVLNVHFCRYFVFTSYFIFIFDFIFVFDIHIL